MATNIRDSGGTDLDDLFDTYVQGTPPGATSFRTSDGVDLAGRYAPLAYGTKRADVNLRNLAGTDLSNLWAQKGSAVYTLPFNGVTYGAASGAKSNESGSVSATILLTIAPDGSWTIRQSARSVKGTPLSGRWLPDGASAGDYAVQFEGAGGSGATVSNGAGGYESCTSARMIEASVSVGAKSADHISATVTITCRLRNAAGAVSATTCYFSVSAQGWV